MLAVWLNDGIAVFGPESFQKVWVEARGSRFQLEKAYNEAEEQPDAAVGVTFGDGQGEE